MKRSIVVIIIIIISPLVSYCQSINLFDIDTRNFPIIKGKIYAFDSSNNQLSPTISDTKLFENNIERDIISINCPPPMSPRQLSSVLTIDISGSMSGANITLAKAGALAW